MSDSSPTKKKGPGRPAGSRNKSSLLRSQLKLDGLTPRVVDTLEAMMNNDTAFLECKDDVPYSIRFNACKEIMAKVIASEKEKAEVVVPSAPEQEDGKTVHTGPQVYSTAK